MWIVSFICHPCCCIIDFSELPEEWVWPTRGCELSRRQTSFSSIWNVCGKECPKYLAACVIWEAMQGSFNFIFLPTFPFSLLNRGKPCLRPSVLMTGKKYLPESPLLLRPVYIVTALVFVIAESDHIAYKKSCSQKNPVFPPPSLNPAQCVKNPGAFLWVLFMQQDSKQHGWKGWARVPLQWCTWVIQLLERAGGRDVLIQFIFLSLACLGVSAAAQRASLKSPAAHPGFWWTEELMWNFSAANFLCPHWGHLFQHFQKAAKLNCLLQPPSKILPLPISAAGSCSESGLGGGGRSSTQIASWSLPGLYLVFLGNVLKFCFWKSSGLHS